MSSSGEAQERSHIPIYSGLRPIKTDLRENKWVGDCLERVILFFLSAVWAVFSGLCFKKLHFTLIFIHCNKYQRSCIIQIPLHLLCCEIVICVCRLLYLFCTDQKTLDIPRKTLQCKSLTDPRIWWKKQLCNLPGKNSPVVLSAYSAKLTPWKMPDITCKRRATFKCGQQHC